jgi:hypothetical protein
VIQEGQKTAYMPNDVKIRLLRREDQYGYYLLPFKPDNPARPVKVAVKRGRQLYVGEAWVDYVDGHWAVELPYTDEEVELIYLE